MLVLTYYSYSYCVSDRVRQFNMVLPFLIFAFTMVFACLNMTFAILKLSLTMTYTIQFFTWLCNCF